MRIIYSLCEKNIGYSRQTLMQVKGDKRTSILLSINILTHVLIVSPSLYLRRN